MAVATTAWKGLILTCAGTPDPSQTDETCLGPRPRSMRLSQSDGRRARRHSHCQARGGMGDRPCDSESRTGVTLAAESRCCCHKAFRLWYPDGPLYSGSLRDVQVSTTSSRVGTLQVPPPAVIINYTLAPRRCREPLVPSDVCLPVSTATSRCKHTATNSRHITYSSMTMDTWVGVTYAPLKPTTYGLSPR